MEADKNNRIRMIFEKIAEYCGMSEEQKKEYLENTYSTITALIMADGIDLMSDEVKNKIIQIFKSDDQAQSSNSLLQEMLEDLNKSDEGKKLIAEKVADVLEDSLVVAASDLTSSQAEEIKKLLLGL